MIEMTEALGVTASQTVGPFFSFGLTTDPAGPYAVTGDAPGAFWIRGTVYDGAGEPVPDAMVETWQADPAGRFDHPDDPRGAAPASVPGFRGWARAGTDAAGEYRIRTVKPGALPGPDGPQAPHLDVSVFARGLLNRVVTRIYFPGEPGNATDPVLAALPTDAARRTLIAAADGDGYRFDVHLQGDDETAFFAI